jgi:hypothetical protein
MIPLVANAGFKILFALIKKTNNEEGLNNCYWVKKLTLAENMV